MGGDGGVIASNRRYLRGVGTASKTGDYNSNKHNDTSTTSTVDDPAVTQYETIHSMYHCAITDRPLQFTKYNATSPTTTKIVTCIYGKLYDKESAIEALLVRKRKIKEINNSSKSTSTSTTADDTINQPNSSSTSTSSTSLLGDHINGLKDLYDIYFEVNDQLKPICPITHHEINGKLITYAFVSGTNTQKKKKTTKGTKSDNINRINVVSDKAIQQMGYKSILNEYSPLLIIDKDNTTGSSTSTIVVDEEEENEEQYLKKYNLQKIRLCPPPSVVRQIQLQLQQQQQQQIQDDNDNQQQQHFDEKKKKNKKQKTKKQKTDL